MSVVKEIQKQRDARIKEIRSQVAPLIQEESELVEMAPGEKVRFVAHAHEDVPAPAPAASEDAPSTEKPERKRRKRQGGTRADQAVAYIADNPGVSATDVATAMKIKPNYLYRVLGDLEKEGRVVKEGTKYSVPASA